MILSEEQRQGFLRLYDTDPEFHAEVDRLLFGEVDDLRTALLDISRMRRSDFGGSGFRYEVAVRQTADKALHRLQPTPTL